MIMLKQAAILMFNYAGFIPLKVTLGQYAKNKQNMKNIPRFSSFCVLRNKQILYTVL